MVGEEGDRVRGEGAAETGEEGGGREDTEQTKHFKRNGRRGKGKGKRKRGGGCWETCGNPPPPPPQKKGA